jgi:hypothetical protein
MQSSNGPQQTRRTTATNILFISTHKDERSQLVDNSSLDPERIPTFIGYSHYRISEDDIKEIKSTHPYHQAYTGR